MLPMPFGVTDQFTELLGSPVTVARNCWVCVGPSVTVEGVTPTEMAPVGPGTVQEPTVCQPEFSVSVPAWAYTFFAPWNDGAKVTATDRVRLTPVAVTVEEERLTVHWLL